MGRMRIKKKEAVIPFRETMAFRLIVVAGWVVVFTFVATALHAPAGRTHVPAAAPKPQSASAAHWPVHAFAVGSHVAGAVH